MNAFVRRKPVRVASGLLVVAYGLYGFLGVMRLLRWI
jgi:hypothetical protein